MLPSVQTSPEPAGDALQEHFAIGTDNGFGAGMFVLSDDPQKPAIVPRAFSGKHLLAFAGLMLLFFVPMGVFVANPPGPPPRSDAAVLMIAGVYLFTCAAFALFLQLQCRSARQQGVRLVYDERKSQVELPHENESFKLDEVVHLQAVLTRPYPQRDDWSEPLQSELHLITCRAGVRRRWLLLGGQGMDVDFEAILRPLSERTPLTIITINQAAMTGSLQVKPYQPRRMQFHVQHLLLATALAAIACALSLTFGWLTLFLMVLTPSFVYIGFRQIQHGKRLGRRADLWEGSLWISMGLLVCLFVVFLTVFRSA